MNQYRPGGFRALTPAVKNLLIINGLFFLATIALQQTQTLDLTSTLGLYPFQSDSFSPYQLLSHMFMHGGFTHILFNMFALWMFGNVLENYWGGKRFLIYYFVCGLGAALLHLLVGYIEISRVMSSLSAEQIDIVMREGADTIQKGMNYTNEGMARMNHILNIPTVGASGAVFGLLLAFGMTFPNSMIYVYFAIPVKAKYFVMVYGAIELYSGIANNPGDNVAHFAHLGGMIFGFILIKLWKKNQFRKL